MLQTIQVSSRVSAQGVLVELLPNGEAVIRDGDTMYRGRPIAPLARAEARPGPADRGRAGRALTPAQSQPASSRSRIATIISTCASAALRQGM